MPRGDRTGPAGAGPMTGRAAGYCAGNDSPGWTNGAAGWGGGFGRGRGGRRGMGFRWGGSRGQRNQWGDFQPRLDPVEHQSGQVIALQSLKDQLARLQQVVSELSDRITGGASEEPRERDDK